MEVKLTPYDEALLPLLESLYRSRALHLTDDEIQALPAIGYVASVNGYFVAAGFLRRLEPHYGMLDSLITHKAMTSEVRNAALKALVDKLIFEAKSLGLKGLLCLTSDSGVLKRAEALGFNVDDQKVIVLELK